MTSYTIVVAHRSKDLKIDSVLNDGLMASFTVHFYVTATKFEICLVMIKSRSRTKDLHIMALLTILIHGTLMEIVMAGKAFFTQAKKGILQFTDVPILDIFGLMAVPTVDHLMLTF
jgi:hypothetical protein